MALVTAAQFNLTPDIVGSVRGGLQNRQMIQEEENKLRLRQQAESQLGTRQRALGVSPEADLDESQVQARLRMIADNPAIAKQLLDASGIINQSQKEEAAAFATEFLATPPEGRDALIDARARMLTSQERDPSNTLGLKDQSPEQQLRSVRGLKTAALTELQRQSGSAGVNRGTPSITELGISAEGEAISLFRDPNDGTVREIKTPTSIITPQEKADIAVRTTERQEGLKLAAKENAAVGKDIRDRARQASRGEIRTNKALTLAKSASQGITGRIRLGLSKIFPGVDSADEGALDQAFKELALEQLQSFKGPTTDFEFGVAQSISGDLGGPKKANIARIKSLKRAQWFARRELQQFRKFKGQARDFIFDFDETIKTKKGEFSLRDLQDTAVSNAMTIPEIISEFNK